MYIITSEALELLPYKVSSEIVMTNLFVQFPYKLSPIHCCMISGVVCNTGWCPHEHLHFLSSGFLHPQPPNFIIDKVTPWCSGFIGLQSFFMWSKGEQRGNAIFHCLGALIKSSAVPGILSIIYHPVVAVWGTAIIIKDKIPALEMGGGGLQSIRGGRILKT